MSVALVEQHHTIIFALRLHPALRPSPSHLTQDQLLAFFLEREKLLNAFKQVDTDHNGTIDTEEMSLLLVSLGA